MSHIELEARVNWYLNFLYMGGASTDDVRDAHRVFFHWLRKMFDVGVIDEPIEPALPFELASERSRQYDEFGQR